LGVDVIAAARTRWVTFDCFGTLVDWQRGFVSAVEALAGVKAPALVRAYHEHERLAEAERPHLSYKEVLSRSLGHAATDVGLTLSATDSAALARAWETMPLFHDVEPMLAALREMGYRLAVLTNCDNDLFSLTHRRVQQPFDMVVTAEQVCDYKPSLSHFRYFDRMSAVGVGQWVHVACSWYHDIVPAAKLGIRSVWLDREDTGENPGATTVRVRSAHDIARIVAKW
jgi:2-haloacid dehalogenase